MTQTISGAGPAVRFSEVLRTATDPAHQEAEQSPFIRRLITGALPREHYTRLVAQQHAIYTALEEEVDRSTDPVATPFLDPALARVPVLDADLRFLRGDDSTTPSAVIPATEHYCARIREASAEGTPGLIAHHYVRYLGDLSGGQIIGRLVARVYELPDGAGTSAYRFDAIPSPKAFKEQYRAALDVAPWDDDTRRWVIEEAIRAFALNTAVFAALEGEADE